jgi:hypothetical protein
MSIDWSPLPEKSSRQRTTPISIMYTSGQTSQRGRPESSDQWVRLRPADSFIWKGNPAAPRFSVFALHRTQQLR